MSDENWIRVRFQANAEDWRPVYKIEEGTPGLGPYWCTGYAGDLSYSIIVAYFRPGVEPTKYWPEAEDIDYGDGGPIIFTSRFPEPDYWKNDPENLIRGVTEEGTP